MNGQPQRNSHDVFYYETRTLHALYTKSNVSRDIYHTLKLN